MNKETFVRAIQYLELGYVIQSNLSDRKIKKVQDNYYWCWEIKDGEYTEWKLYQDNEGIFTSGEINNSWYVLKND